MSKSYKQYVTLIRNQSGGGCGTMASLAILDILKKLDFAGSFFVPTASYAFAARQYDDPNSDAYRGQLEVLEKYGCCSEVSMPTNFDRGPPIGPSPSQLDEASRYKILGHGAEEIPTVEKLIEYLGDGPIWATGTAVSGNQQVEHVVAIIGYDDTNREFEFVNSWGDRYNETLGAPGSGGFGIIPYDHLFDGPQFKLSKIRRIKNLHCNEPFHKYTGRILVETTNLNPTGDLDGFGRNVLRIAVSAGDEEPIVVWDRNNHYIGKGPNNETVYNSAGLFDNSRALRLDFPLPAYAQKYWPPFGGDRIADHTWKLIIENHSAANVNPLIPTVEALIKQFSIAGFEPEPRTFYSADFPVPTPGMPSGTLVQPGQRVIIKLAPSVDVIGYALALRGYFDHSNNAHLQGQLSRFQRSQGQEYEVFIKAARIVLKGMIYDSDGNLKVGQEVARVITGDYGGFGAIYTGEPIYVGFRAFFMDDVAVSEICAPDKLGDDEMPPWL